MATIYSIKGTDSISSSRLNINDNFTNVNTALVEIHSLFTVASQDLGITGTLAAGGNVTATGNITATGTLNATGLTSVVDLNNSGKVIKSGVLGAASTLPSVGAFTKSTYQVTCSGTTASPGTTDGLENGENGQEILIVCDPAATAATAFKITPTAGNIKNVATHIILTAGDDTKDFVLLRYVTDKWVIISVGSGVTVL